MFLLKIKLKILCDRELLHQANPETQGSLVYSSTGVSDSGASIYNDSQINTPASVYQSDFQSDSSTVFSGNTSQNTSSTAYSGNPNQAPITVYSEQSKQQSNTVYSQSGATSSQATVYDRTANQVVDQTVDTNSPNAINIAAFASDEATELLPPSASFEAGDIVPAKLVTGLSVSKGDKSPLVAVSEGDWCGQVECESIRWLGTASYTNRVVRK